MYEQNKDHLSETAIIYFNKEITYRELIDDIKQVASALVAMGIGKGDIVTLQVLNMPQTVILFYALSYIGAIANFVYITVNNGELHDILCETDSKMYVVIGSLWEKTKESINNTNVQQCLLLDISEKADLFTKLVIRMKHRARYPDKCLSWNELMLHGNKAPYMEAESEAPVAMVYTSGTTGKSKTVVLSNRSMNALALQYKYTYTDLMRGGVFMNSLPQFIAFGLVCAMHMPLCLGFKEVLVLNPSPTESGKYFAKYKPGYFVNGRAAIENIIHNPKVSKMDLGFIKVLAAGGDVMPESFEMEVNDFLRSHNSSNKLSIGYGMTEVAATVVTSTPKVTKIGTVGIPLPGTVVKIVEPDTINELGYNIEGEVCFSAPSMMLGYYEQPDETSKVIRKHSDGLEWVHSGDLGKIDEDGFLTIVGRMKRLILIRDGEIYHKLAPKTIEDKFATIAEVRSVAIVGRRNDLTENELVVFVVKNRQDSDLDIKALKQFAYENLEKWEQPAEYVSISELPLTDVGKIDYRKLEDQVKCIN